MRATAEQNTGVSLVNETVTALDQSTQQYAALVEETAAVAKAMTEQALVLNKTVGVFRTTDAGSSRGLR